MSFYRNTYLKSEDWKNLRLAALAQHHCRCQICGAVSDSNDVHHIKYRKLYDVSIHDLRVLCRSCHEKVHSLLRQYPSLKSLARKEIWKIVRDHLRKDLRDAHWVIKSNRKSEAKLNKRRMKFSRYRDQLVLAEKVFRNRMVWKESLAASENFPDNVDEFLAFYILKTQCDPRLQDQQEHEFT